VNLLVDNLNKQNMRLATPVETIHWRNFVDSEKDHAITVTTSEGAQIFANAVIVTCSLGYLKENYQKMFQPSLPKHLNDAIENLGFDTINKIFLDFGEPWWQTDVKGFQLLWREDTNHCWPEWTKDLTGFDVLPTQRATLIAWVGGQGARIIENLSEKTVAQDCVKLLSHYLSNYDIPPVTKCTRTRWYGNKYVRGGYSHIMKNCEKDNISPKTLAEPVWAITSRNDVKEVRSYRNKNVVIVSNWKF